MYNNYFIQMYFLFHWKSYILLYLKKWKDMVIRIHTHTGFNIHTTRLKDGLANLMCSTLLKDGTIKGATFLACILWWWCL